MLDLGLIGYPLTHTLSPVLHGFLLQALGISGRYRPYEIAPEQLLTQLDALQAQGLRGWNVTIPHKVDVIPWLDWCSPEAALIGAVNTIVLEPDSAQNEPRKKGYNTDITGFVRSLPVNILDQLTEATILMLGAGGSARAVLAGLIQQHTKKIVIAARDEKKAQALLQDAETITLHFQATTQLAYTTLDALPCLEPFYAVINTTPIGMWPNTDVSLLTVTQLQTLPTEGFVYDLIYRPLQTRLLQEADALGLQTINGLDMLLLQGVAALELWQSQPVPESLLPALRQHVLSALETSQPAS